MVDGLRSIRAFLSLRTALLSVAGIVAVACVSVVSLRQPSLTPVTRGEGLAEELGCFGCHGPAGLGGSPNPGSAAREVPPLQAAGPLLYYIQDPGEIREWILEGSLARIREQRGEGAESDGGEVLPAGLIAMPAYAGVISESELEDLVAYVASASRTGVPAPPAAAEGKQLALDLGCFGCHGADGKGGLPNPGSFVGIIPPWDGDDFEELVRDDDELRHWILDGTIERFEANPLAAFFLHRQVIKMPAYRDAVTDEGLDALVAYIHWLRDARRESESPWKSHPPAATSSVVARGQWLYRSAGCVSCHGPEGRGGVLNRNAVGGFVPALDDLAEKMELFEPEQVSAVLEAIERQYSFEAMSHDPPIPDLEGFFDQYQELQKAILEGGRTRKRDSSGSEPPIHMPGWGSRVHADPGPVSIPDVDAILAYLLTLQPPDAG